MGQVILSQLVADAGLGAKVRVSSSGTGDWHVGNPADPRTIEVLAEHGYDGSHHRAREFDPSEFEDLDLVLAADEGHVRQLTRWARGPEDRAKIRLMREFDPEAVAAGTLETDDPYLVGARENFLRCFDEVEAACLGVFEHLRSRVT